MENKTWEYTYLRLDNFTRETHVGYTAFEYPKLNKKLNELGNAGWKLIVTIRPPTYTQDHVSNFLVLKREKIKGL